MQYLHICFHVTGRRFNAHRALVSSCPVLRAFFDRDAAEGAPKSKASAPGAVITIDDHSSEAFECVLRFIYSGSLTTSDKSILLEVFLHQSGTGTHGFLLEWQRNGEARDQECGRSQELMVMVKEDKREVVGHTLQDA